ncbi:LapA family protein [Nocardia altamirensis]|uniref:LapA family protein n=1 Tax=Nocardia altamirensis TaxID=472158 RepID=UPI0008406F12|nr:lipopolysaccharide assembly protein LapA domain-containing protein [Nocardia altamirensis]
MSTNAEHLPDRDPALPDDRVALPDERTTPPQTPPATTAPTTVTKPRKSLSSRTGNTWVGLIAGALILIVLLVFILQNLDQVYVSLFFWHFSLPLGVAVLLSVIGGALVMALVGGVRILQLRRAAKK